MPPAIATTPLAACPTRAHVQFCLDDRGKTLTKDRMIFDTQHANGIKMGHSMGRYCSARCTLEESPAFTALNSK